MSNTETTEITEAEGGIAQLRESARRGEHALKENAELKRRLMFAEAGVDMEGEIGQMLYATWQGEDNLAELTEKATRLGAVKGAAAPAPEVDAARAAEDARRAEAYANGAGGATTPPQFSGDNPIDEAVSGYRAAQSQMGEAVAQQDAFLKVISAGAAGDRRAIFNHDAHHEAAKIADQQYGRPA